MADTDVHQARGFWWYLQDRAGRREYWIWFAGLFALSLAFGSIPALSLGLAIGLLIVQIRRVHDFGRSGWWAVASMVVPTLIGIAVFFATNDEETTVLIASTIQLALVALIGAIPGSKEANRFGPPPPLTVKRVLTGR